MKRLVFIFLVLPFFIMAIVCFAIIGVAINEYGRIDCADIMIFIFALMWIVAGLFMNKLKNKLLKN